MAPPLPPISAMSIPLQQLLLLHGHAAGFDRTGDYYEAVYFPPHDGVLLLPPRSVLEWADELGSALEELDPEDGEVETQLSWDEPRGVYWFARGSEEPDRPVDRLVIRHRLTLAELAVVEAGTLREADLSFDLLNGAQLAFRDVRSANFDGAALREALLVGARAEGCSLIGADLAGATLDSAHLRGADLSGAHLDGVSLCWADLRNATLAGCACAGTDFTRADLRGANLSSGRITGADFSGALWDDSTAWPGHKAPVSAFRPR